MTNTQQPKTLATVLLDAVSEINTILAAGIDAHPMADRLRNQANVLSQLAEHLAAGCLQETGETTNHVVNASQTQTEVALPTRDESHQLQLENIRDLLVKGWVDEANKYVQDLLNVDPCLGVQSGAVIYLKAFEKAFWTACRKNNVLAAYIVLEKRPQPDNTMKYVLITGGNHLAETVVSYYLQPLASELGLEQPVKRYLEPGFLEKAATWP